MIHVGCPKSALAFNGIPKLSDDNGGVDKREIEANFTIVQDSCGLPEIRLTKAKGSSVERTMELAEIVGFARNFATMVRVKGADPKGLKARNHAFHNYNSGITTISASGMLLPDNLRNACLLTDGRNTPNLAPGCAVVVSVASIVEPFLAIKTKEANAPPELIPHAQIDVMIEKGLMKQSVEGMDNHASQWLPAKILKLVDVPVSSRAVRLLMESSSPSLEHSWEVGWSLGSNANHPKGAVNEIHSQSEMQQSRQPDLMAKSITRMVFLQVPDLCKKDMPEVNISPSCNRGDLFVALGSPFGILSPVHFFNSVSAGFIANCYPPTTYDKSLLMADIHCLPGMEGAPIISHQSNLIGLLTKPLSQNGGAEIQLIIPWKAIEAACRDSCMLVCQNEWKEIQSIKEIQNSDMIMPATSIKKQLTSCSDPSLVEQAMASVCLVTVGNGVWASGIVLNSDGLILTNAHLIEPWRFGGATLSSGCDENKAVEPITFFKDSAAANKKANDSHPAFRGVRQISVRLDHVDPWIWCPAKVVYVCQGTLDIALLLLESAPTQLCPINVDLSHPTQGSKAFVIGHGLFGPRCGLYPSVSSGVVAQVVKSGLGPASSPSLVDNVRGELPAMIQTTAAVHPGSSGGAVVNSIGSMIGLVTSNVKHGGQTIIPHLNFSIPCAAMEPIFKFAADMKNTSVLHELDKPNKKLSSVWSLVPPLPAEPRPSIPSVQEMLKKDKQGKGSQFAKFIAEKEGLFKKFNQVKTSASLSRDTIPSKL